MPGHDVDPAALRQRLCHCAARRVPHDGRLRPRRARGSKSVEPGRATRSRCSRRASIGLSGAGLWTLLKSGGGSQAAVPEPASIMLMALALPGLAFAAAVRRCGNCFCPRFLSVF
jgi:hypothetical protein